MKFWHILMFMIIFNMTIIIVNQLHIYNMTAYSAGAMGFTSIYAEAQIIFGSLLSGIAVATFITYLTKTPSDAGIAYGVMTGLYFFASANAISVIVNIAPGEPGIAVVVSIFSGILVFIWAGALLQMVRGGWRTYE